MMANPKLMSRLKVVPEGTVYTPAKKREDMAMEKFEMWLMKLTCAMFEVPPQEIGFTESINRATAEVQSEGSKDKGLRPLAKFVKEIFDTVIQQDLFEPELEFVWPTLDEQNEAEKVDLYTKMVQTGRKSIDEWRVEDGEEPIGLGHYVVAGGTPYLVEDIVAGKLGMNSESNQPDQQPPVQQEEEDQTKAMMDDLKKWQRFCLNRVKDGKALRPFESNNIPPFVKRDIELFLQEAYNAEAVQKAFDPYLGKKFEIIQKVLELKNAIDGTAQGDRPGTA
jgi:hypothetical protein